MANTPPRVTSRDTTVLADEVIQGRSLIRAKDDDGDEIIRYRVTQRASDPGDGNNGYFLFKGVKMALNVTFFVKAAELQQLVFVSAERGQRNNSVDNIFIRAYDGQDWGAHKKISVRTLHNRYRPVVTPNHQALISDREIQGMELFDVFDPDGNTIKYYRFRDVTTNQDSAYLRFKGVNMQGAGWFTVNPEDMGQLQLVGGLRTFRDRIQVRAFDGRRGSLGKVAIVNTLERPVVGTTNNVIFNELERKPLTDLLFDDGSNPPIQKYEFMDLNSDPFSGKVRRNFFTYAANQVHSVSRGVWSSLDFQGGLYDQRSRDTFLVRAHNGEFWSAWQNVDFITEPHYVDSLTTDEDWTQFLPSPPEPGDPLTITYSFLQRVPDYYADGAAENDGFSRMTAAARVNVRKVLTQIAEVINVRFVEVNDLIGGVMRFGWHDKGATNPGRAYVPEDPEISQLGGDIWFNNFVDFPTIFWPGVYGDDRPGTRGQAYMRRLILEGMGLKIPSTGTPLLPPATDNHRYTSMAHNFAFQVPIPDGDNYRYAETTQLYDNAAMRELYGANPLTRLGDDVYMFDNDRQTVSTIVDRGGVDTLDFGNQDQGFGAIVDLRQGAFSSFGQEFDNFDGIWVAAIDNLGISYGAEIENARGTVYDDMLVGNELDNTLAGRDGQDYLNGRDGDDILIGGRDDDTYRFDLFGGNDTLDDQDSFSVDTLEIHSHSDDLSSFTQHLSFRKSGGDLVVNLTLNQNQGRDLIDGTVTIKNMSGLRGVETLRLVDHSGGNIEGVDIDLTSVYANATSVDQHMQITAVDGTYGKLVAPV